MKTTAGKPLSKLQPPFLRKSHLSAHSVGALGERIVQKKLRQKLFYIWDTNWSIREGEIDIVAQFDSTLHFFEVKTRVSSKPDSAFPPEQAVDIHKTEKLRLLADLYLYKKQAAIRRYRIQSMQFDIAAVTITNRYLLRGHCVEMHWNAFPFQTIKN